MESKVNETNQESRPKMSIYDEAVSCISSDELESLYGIFLYYNSAMEGDSLPSINFSRFHVFLKDASIMKLKFDLDLVQTIFSKAVTTKMRGYLDADGHPTLTFRIFCVAIMHCAIAKYSTLDKGSAMRKLMYRHLSPLLVRLTSDDGEKKSLTANVGGYWCPNDAIDSDLEDLTKTSLSLDKCIKTAYDDENEHACQGFEVSEIVKETFSAPCIAYVISKFEVFNARSRRTIYKDELLAFMATMAVELDYEHIENINSYVNNLQDDFATLEDVFQILENCEGIRLKNNRAVQVAKAEVDEKSKSADSQTGGTQNLNLRRLTMAKQPSKKLLHDVKLSGSGKQLWRTGSFRI